MLFLKFMGIDDFPGGAVVKNLPANAGDMGPIPESGRSPGEGNGNPRQYSCLENAMDRGAYQATLHGVTKSRTQFSDQTSTSDLAHMHKEPGILCVPPATVGKI